MRTLEQQRAQDAWDKTKNPNCGKEYMKLAKGLPALIMNSGLMQVMAFLHEKGLDEKGNPKPDDHHTLLGEHLRQWLNDKKAVRSEFEYFMEDLMKADARKFQEITTEAFAWLRWMRQMAAARVGGE